MRLSTDALKDPDPGISDAHNYAGVRGKGEGEG